jgi:hypothetical protein
VELRARSATNAVVATSKIPADWDEPAVPDTEAPLYVSTRSDSSDFTKVFGLEGHVGAAGAVRLQLRYTDGETVSIPIQVDRSYEYTVPPARQGSFMTPQSLVALDASGRTVAEQSVAAVAFWRRRSR